MTQGDRPNWKPLLDTVGEDVTGDFMWMYEVELEDADARGNLVPDAHLAAIAMEHGATVATRDRGFARFPGLRWIDPLREP